MIHFCHELQFGALTFHNIAETVPPDIVIHADRTFPPFDGLIPWKFQRQFHHHELVILEQQHPHPGCTQVPVNSLTLRKTTSLLTFIQLHPRHLSQFNYYLFNVSPFAMTQVTTDYYSAFTSSTVESQNGLISSLVQIIQSEPSPD